jgi:hypothetical protein
MGGEAPLAASSRDPRLGASARVRPQIPAQGAVHAKAVAAAQRADRRRTGVSVCALIGRIGPLAGTTADKAMLFPERHLSMCVEVRRFSRSGAPCA